MVHWFDYTLDSVIFGDTKLVYDQVRQRKKIEEPSISNCFMTKQRLQVEGQKAESCFQKCWNKNTKKVRFGSLSVLYTVWCICVMASSQGVLHMPGYIYRGFSLGPKIPLLFCHAMQSEQTFASGSCKLGSCSPSLKIQNFHIPPK